jgi:DNA-binding LacI/PurR family transcriptional regulator
MVRIECAGALSKLGANASSAVPALTTASQDPDQLVAEAAKAAIQKIQGK